MNMGNWERALGEAKVVRRGISNGCLFQGAERAVN
jgi:hypothetical protein